MRKFLVYIGMFLVAAIIAGVYGSIHDQISYSFSNEYFTKFKFIQFSTPWAYDSPRIGAAYVGFMATWWMGFLIFSILGLFGFMFPSPKLMALNLVKSFIVVTIVALFTGLVGLGYGYYQINETTITQYNSWVSSSVVNPIQFVRVGFMHNASYLGGLTGLVSGVIYLFLSKKSYNNAKQAKI